MYLGTEFKLTPLPLLPNLRVHVIKKTNLHVTI